LKTKKLVGKFFNLPDFVVFSSQFIDLFSRNMDYRTLSEA